MEQKADTYVGWSKDADYQGAQRVVEDELTYIAKRRARYALGDADEAVDPRSLTGLALSGGGIRSATFCLGVLQALAERDLLKRFDYLSTVSGGGYIGTSLSWFLHKGRDGVGPMPPLGVERGNFPFGDATRNPEADDATAFAAGRYADGDSNRSRLLRHLRQHGKYLAPGDGIGIRSLIAVILRGMLISLLVYFPPLVVVLLALLGLFGYQASTLLGAAGVLAGLFGASALIYALFTSNAGAIDEQSRRRQHCDPEPAYAWRRRYEIYAPWLLLAALALALVGSLPWAAEQIRDYLSQTGLLSALSGIAASLWAFSRSGGGGRFRLSPTLLAGTGAGLLLYGLMLLAYQWIGLIRHGNDSAAWLLIAALAVGLVVAYLADLDMLTVHRYYRDRLMETFMPDPQVMQHGGCKHGHVAAEADRTPLSALCSDDVANAPYHLINSNVVLVQSPIHKFRGRGGDNFVLSPRWCGSNATGWRQTRDYLDDDLSAATAMAISGAAANPDAGVGGEGPTRNRILSMVMTLLNLRLGMWMPNPDPQLGPAPFRPNFLRPGLGQLLPYGAMTERHPYLQLSDGGHFENTAVYELLRRRCRLIVACDLGADPDFKFGDLANLVEKARVDFGVRIEFDDSLQRLKPGSAAIAAQPKLASSGFARASISYPGDWPDGVLILLKSTLVDDLPADVQGYAADHPEFPDQTTADQFFDEAQFEAYRELGYELAGRMTYQTNLEDLLGG